MARKRKGRVDGYFIRCMYCNEIMGDYELERYASDPVAPVCDECEDACIWEDYFSQGNYNYRLATGMRMLGMDESVDDDDDDEDEY